MDDTNKDHLKLTKYKQISKLTTDFELATAAPINDSMTKSFNAYGEAPVLEDVTSSQSLVARLSYSTQTCTRNVPRQSF